MSLLGKILIILNILGAAGLAALASMDYARRQSWSYAVFRNELMLTGLPLDDTDHELGGEARVEKLSDDTLKEVCVTEPAVATQEKEVERVQRDLQARIKQLAGTSKRAEIETLAQVLLPQSLSNAQREDYLACRTHLATDASLAEMQKSFKEAYAAAAERAKKDPDNFDREFNQVLHDKLVEPAHPFIVTFLQLRKATPQAPFDKLFGDMLEQLRAGFQARLDDAFRAAKGERVIGKATQKSTAEERRKEIARLLFVLVDVLPDARTQPDLAASRSDLVNSKAFQRYINIVGLQHAVRQLKEQAQILQRIASELDAAVQEAALDQEVIRDRSRFIQEHQALLNEIRVRADEVRVMNTYLARKKAQRDFQRDMVVVPRRKNVKDVEEELDASRKQTAEEMAALRRLSQALFDKRVEVRDALEQNYQYERKLRELEANR